ncbi:hypothetical protein A2U01_0061959, partial [Trifolium medium]|nr:hypothetical protein [Trifolium medium]
MENKKVLLPHIFIASVLNVHLHYEKIRLPPSRPLIRSNSCDQTPSKGSDLTPLEIKGRVDPTVHTRPRKM